jgi:hypothetical protein
VIDRRARLAGELFMRRKCLSQVAAISLPEVDR